MALPAAAEPRDNSYTPVELADGAGELPGTIRMAPVPLQVRFAVIVRTAAKVNGKETFSADSAPEVYKFPHVFAIAVDTDFLPQHSAIPFSICGMSIFRLCLAG